MYEELKSTQEKMQQEMRHRQGLEDEILRLKQSLADNCSEEVPHLHYNLDILMLIFQSYLMSISLFDSLKHYVVWLDQDLD